MSKLTYGDKRDYEKIDIYVRSGYVGTTTWANGLKQAKQKFLEKNPTIHRDSVRVYYANEGEQ
jgi:hypothetical protein